MLPNCLMNDKSRSLVGKSQIRKLFLYLTVEQLGLHLVDHYWLEALFSLLLTPTVWQEDYPRISLSGAQHRTKQQKALQICLCLESFPGRTNWSGRIPFCFKWNKSIWNSCLQLQEDTVKLMRNQSGGLTKGRWTLSPSRKQKRAALPVFHCLPRFSVLP